METTWSDVLAAQREREEVTENFLYQLEQRPMSSWSAEEMHNYSVLTGQGCPACGGFNKECNGEGIAS